MQELQQQAQKKMKAIDDAKAKYARGAYTNVRRSHVKDGIGYKQGVKHNARINKNGTEFIKFTKESGHQKKQVKTEKQIKNTNKSSLICDLRTNVPNPSCALFNDFDATYVLMRNKYGRVYAKYVGPRNKTHKSCVWVPKALVTNVRGPKQIWVPKNKA